MAYGMNMQDLARFFGESNAIISDPQAQFAGFSLELFDIALAGFRKALERHKNTHGSISIQAANVGARLL